VQGEVARSVQEPAGLAGCLATGSVVRHALGGRRFLMAHTVRHAGPNPGVVLRGSDDLRAWHLVGDGPALTLADDRDGHYEAVGTGRRAVPHFRDPFLFEWDGALHFMVCASREVAGRGGTVAVARWDGEQWRLLPPPELPAICDELECPQVHADGPNDWRLVFSTNRDWIDPAVANASGVYTFRGPTPLGPWSDFRSLHTDNLYAGQLLRHDGRWLLIGTDFAGRGSLTDPVDVTASVV
ncbi:MAG: hypothetical protein AAGK78_12725, partial [Planctomycetota bacterium]